MGVMQEHTADDQSHYEISLTAGQAFVAFVLLLLSLAASFAFGLMLGKGQADDRLVVQKETPVVAEASVTPKKAAGEIVELGVTTDDFQETNTAPAEAAPEVAPVSDTAIVEEGAAPAAMAGKRAAPVEQPADPTPVEPEPVETKAVVTKPAAEAAAAAQTTSAARAVPHLAQLLSTADQKTAESLAVKLIDRGYTNAYVERGTTEKGPVYRVRVRFPSETEARASEPKLREFSKDVWITAAR
jgi:cell division septation protein DedD